MGIYANKYLLENDLDSVQDPNDVGNDLDQIEKDIAGPDGIEAHSDEIEDAQTGVVGDPLEEAFMIMYESEYNYNQLLECIGIHELNAASRGCYLVLEEVDQVGFIEKVKEFFKNAWASIVEAYKNIIKKIQEETAFDKKFVAKYEKEIRAGAAKWAEEADKLPEAYAFADIKMYTNEYHLGKVRNTSNEEVDAKKAEIIKHCSGVDASTTKEMIEKLQKQVYGDKAVILSGNLSVDNLIAIMKGDNEIKAIKEAYEKIKESYKRAMKTLEEMKTSYLASNKADNEGNKADMKAGKEDIMVTHNFRVKLLKHEIDVQNIRYAFYTKAARAKRAQTRHIIHQCKAKAPAVSHESTSINDKGFFNNMQFV